MHLFSLRFISLLALVTLLSLPNAYAQKSPPTLPDKAPDSTLLGDADAIASKIAAMRALPIKAPLKKGLQTRRALRKTLMEKISKDYTQAQFDHESLVYQRLDLLPPNVDYKQLIIDLYTQQIAGFYDPNTQELYIIKGLPGVLQRSTMAHEIFHAIQDQHFNIKAIQQAPDDFQDFQIARSALLEGDATLLTIDFNLYDQGELPKNSLTSAAQIPTLRLAMGSLDITDAQAMNSMFSPDANPGPTEQIPNIITYNMLFPYIGGLRFVLAAFDKLGSWEAMRSLYANPPVSTEQILHPERYFDKDLPTILTFDVQKALTQPQWKPIYDAQFGEFQLYLMLREWLSLNPESPQLTTNLDGATQGWDGDRMIAWKDDKGRLLLAHLSVWDTPKDAAEYYQAWQTGLQKRWSSSTSELQQQSARGGYGQATCFTHRTLGPTPFTEHAYLEQWGDLVLTIEGLPSHQDHAAQMKTIRNAIFNSMKRTPWENLPASTFQTQAPSPSNAPSK